MSETIKIGADWLNACPSGVLAVAADGRVLWANATLEEMLGIAAAELVGKVPADLPGLLNPLLDEQQPIIVINGDAGEQRWLRRDAREVATAAPLRLHFYQDISEQVQVQRERDQLLRKVEELTLNDPLTGLLNRRALIQNLGTQVTRSRRYHNPLALALVQVVFEGQPTDAPLADELVLAVSRYLRDRLRWADLIGRYSQQRFMMILPETDLAAAENLFDKIRHELDRMELPDRYRELSPQLLCGLAEWQKGFDSRLLIEGASETLDRQIENLAATTH